MILLIDGFNAIYKFSELEDLMYRSKLEQAQREFICTVSEFKAVWKKPLTIHIFFDGKKRQGDETERETINDIIIYYSHERSADFLIKEFIRHSASPAELCVVSSDKDVLFFARGRKCQLRTSEEFFSWVTTTMAHSKSGQTENKSDIHLSKSEVDYWLNLFKNKKNKK